MIDAHLFALKPEKPAVRMHEIFSISALARRHKLILHSERILWPVFKLVRGTGNIPIRNTDSVKLRTSDSSRHPGQFAGTIYGRLFTWAVRQPLTQKPLMSRKSSTSLRTLTAIFNLLISRN